MHASPPILNGGATIASNVTRDRLEIIAPMEDEPCSSRSRRPEVPIV